jgi:hypothetical protein
MEDKARPELAIDYDVPERRCTHPDHSCAHDDEPVDIEYGACAGCTWRERLDALEDAHRHAVFFKREIQAALLAEVREDYREYGLEWVGRLIETNNRYMRDAETTRRERVSAEAREARHG